MALVLYRTFILDLQRYLTGHNYIAHNINSKIETRLGGSSRPGHARFELRQLVRELKFLIPANETWKSNSSNKDPVIRYSSVIPMAVTGAPVPTVVVRTNCPPWSV